MAIDLRFKLPLFKERDMSLENELGLLGIFIFAVIIICSIFITLLHTGEQGMVLFLICIVIFCCISLGKIYEIRYIMRQKEKKEGLKPVEKDIEHDFKPSDENVVDIIRQREKEACLKTSEKDITN